MLPHPFLRSQGILLGKVLRVLTVLTVTVRMLSGEKVGTGRHANPESQQTTL